MLRKKPRLKLTVLVIKIPGCCLPKRWVDFTLTSPKLQSIRTNITPWLLKYRSNKLNYNHCVKLYSGILCRWNKMRNGIKLEAHRYSRSEPDWQKISKRAMKFGIKPNSSFFFTQEKQCQQTIVNQIICNWSHRAWRSFQKN